MSLPRRGPVAGYRRCVPEMKLCIKDRGGPPTRVILLLRVAPGQAPGSQESLYARATFSPRMARRPESAIGATREVDQKSYPVTLTAKQ